MKSTYQITLALVMGLLTLATACSKRDQAIDVADDDPEMLAAIAKARATLPEYWRAYENPTQGESDFALKVRITDEHGTEHFWATDIERHDGRIMGTINNDPNIVEAVKLGDNIQILEADISDWLYMRDDKMVGNQTLRPLLKSLPPDEAEQLKSMMAEP